MQAARFLQAAKYSNSAKIIRSRLIKSDGNGKNKKTKGIFTMKTFNYTIKDEIGIHARPAGLLAKKAKEFESTITLEKNGKSVNVTKLMMLMGLGVKCGETVTVTVEGPDEDKAAAEMEAFFNANL